MNVHKQTPPSLTKLVSSWLTVSLIFVSGQSVLLYGALAGFIILGAYLTALLLLIPFFRLSRENKLPKSPFMSLLKSIVFIEKFSIPFLIVILIFFSHESYDSYLFAIGICLVLILMVILIARGTGKITTIKVSILLCLAIFLPNYIFLQKGLETVYHNLLHYHPRFLHLEQDGAGTFYLMLTAVFFSNLFVQLPFLETYVGTQFWKGIRKLLIGFSIWSPFILAFSTMTLVSFAYNDPTGVENNLFFIMLNKHVKGVFNISILLCLCLSSFIEIFQATRKLNNMSLGWKIVLIGGAVLLAVSFYFSGVSILNLFLLYGSLLAICCFGHLIYLIINHQNIKSRKIDIN